jgi:hypothetical protein
MADREAELRSELRPGAGPALIPVARATDSGRSVGETARAALPAAGKRTTGERTQRH